jgi:hypothetical protein
MMVTASSSNEDGITLPQEDTGKFDPPELRSEQRQLSLLSESSEREGLPDLVTRVPCNSGSSAPPAATL